MFSRDAQDEPHADFSRSNGTAAISPPKFPAPPTLAQSPMGQRLDSAPPEKPTSILGPDISISGQQLVLKTKGSLLIRGQIQGDVHGEAVTVDHGASVTGVITARTVEIQGSVKGALKGSTVILHEHSTVEANIVHQKLSIAEGAQFDGSARRARDISEVTPDLS
jgi:cytoskeletal protein CcmA (bactofilin family)